MKILAILQNQWFKNPAKTQAIYDRNPELRNKLIARFLFAGCLTGKRLLTALGQELCNQIIWEEANSKIGGFSGSNFGADIPHIKEAINKHNPDLIVCFGKIAGDALRQIEAFAELSAKVIYAPHPASRQNPMASLKELKEKIIFQRPLYTHEVKL